MRKTWNILSLSCSYLLALHRGLSQFDLKSVAGLELNLGSGREGLDPSWLPQRGAGARGAHTHTHRARFILHPLPASQMKERGRLKTLPSHPTGHWEELSPGMPVFAGETCPGSPVPLLGKGSFSSIQLISREKLGYWVKLGACRMQQIKPTEAL